MIKTVFTLLGVILAMIVFALILLFVFKTLEMG